MVGPRVCYVQTSDRSGEIHLRVVRLHPQITEAIFCTISRLFFFVQMRIATCLVILCVAFSACNANVLKDKVAELKGTFTNMGSQLKTVGGLLKDQAVDGIKSLGGQAAQGWCL